jgi:hypothetical protein
MDRCESGWTGDRCVKPLGHPGAHSNQKYEEVVPHPHTWEEMPGEPPYDACVDCGAVRF